MTDLLKVLDMSEDFQWNFLVSHQDIQELCEHQLDAFCQKKFKRRILADLAFRLRNEVKGSEGHEKWVKSTQKVFEYIHPGNSNNLYSVAAYFCDKAQPINWIIAALIAKEGKENE